jgi:hypothetical protein
MKRLIIPLILCVLAAAVSLAMTRPSGHWEPQRLEIHKDYIFIPGTSISAEDRAAVKKILKKYDRSFYRVEPYDQGAPKKLLGAMREVQVGGGFSRDVAKARGFTAWTTKIGMGCNPTRCTQATPTPHRAGADPSDTMVSEVTPILRKYSK